MNRNFILSFAIAGAALLIGACTNTQTAKQTAPTSFETPPAWLDRVSLQAYNPPKPGGEPALGDYENEPARFYFQGVPLMANEDDQSAGEEAPAGEGLPGDILSSQSFSAPGG